MDIKGLWTIVSAKVMNMTTFEMEWTPKKKLLELPEDHPFKMFSRAMFEFEDTKYNMLAPIPIPEDTPQPEIDEAVAAGKLKMVDGQAMLSESHDIKFEDGKYFADSGERGTVFDEPINPWKPIEECGNTLILSNQYQIVRVGETPSEVKETVKEVKQVNAETAAAAGTYVGKYTYFVGSPEDKKTDEPFTLILNADGTGTQNRNDLEIKVPDWSLTGNEFKMTEKFLGTIDYTGTLEGTKLTLFNGDPANNFTCAYVYEKE
ncbi:MAG: hypothetical protein K6G24_08970 [Lachnospiraceae bacterium]|nr:hypothetical protein [Lachnospiraceae bacterium]